MIVGRLTIAPPIAWAELKNCLNYPVMQEFRASVGGLTLTVRGRAGGSVWRWKITDCSANDAFAEAMSFMPNQAAKADAMMNGTQTKPAFCSHI